MFFSRLLCLSAFLLTSSATFAQSLQMEVAFSIQNNDLTWFNIANPNIQGSISVTGIPDIQGNALAYDSDRNRLLFVAGGDAANRPLYGVDLNGITLWSGQSVNAGAVKNLGNISTPGTPQLLGASYAYGSYYTLSDASDSLIRMTFDSSGNLLTQNGINLPTPNDPNMYLGDIAFDSNNDLWISGFNSTDAGINDDRVWHYSSTDGNTFTHVGTLSPAGTRYNGILIDSDDVLWGYRSPTQTYGSLDTTTGAFTVTYTGSPFGDAGDLTNGFLIGVAPEPSSSFLVLIAMSLFVYRSRSRRLC